MKKKSLNIHKRDNQSFRHRLLLSIFRIAAPVTAIVCTVSIVMLTLNYRQTVINSQAAATEKVRSDIAHIVDNTQILSQEMIFNSEIQQILASSTAGEQFPQNTDVAYHINGFIANRDYINCVILTGNNQTLYSTEKAFTNISDYDTIFHSTHGSRSYKTAISHICGMWIRITHLYLPILPARILQIWQYRNQLPLIPLRAVNNIL